MATILAPRPANEILAARAFAATAVTGDVVLPSGAYSTLLIELRNTHTSAIVVTINPSIASPGGQVAGRVTKQPITLSIAASADAELAIDRSFVQYYADGSGAVPLTYAAGNTLLLIRAATLA